MWVVLTRHEPAASHAEHDEKKGSEKAEAHSPDEVKMDRDRQSRAGLETAVIKAAEWSP